MGHPEPKPMAVVVSRPPSNSLGIAGVIISTVGLMTCGLLSPIGLLFSVIGLFKSPRGSAIAGTVIGAFGMLLFTVVGLSIIGLIGAMGPGFESMRDALVGVGGSLAVKQFYDEHGRLPDDAEGQAAIDATLGQVAAEVQYRRQDDQRFEIRLAGPDRAWDTADDRVSSFHTADWKSAPIPGAVPRDEAVHDAAEHDAHGHDAHGHDAHGHDAHGHEATEHDAHGHDAHASEDGGMEPVVEPSSDSAAPEIEAEPARPGVPTPLPPSESPEESSLQPMSDVIFALTRVA